MTQADDGAIEKEAHIAARPETVFSFLVEPAKMTRWMGTTAELDPKPGGIFKVNVTGKDMASGQYREVIPNTKVVFTWGWEEEGGQVPPGSTTIEITLASDGDGTILRMRHSGLAVERRDSHADGWDHYLSRLEMAAAGRDPGPDPWVQAA